MIKNIYKIQTALFLFLLIFSSASGQWVRDTLPGTFDNMNIRDVKFSDNENGIFVFGNGTGDYARTTDAGKNWQFLTISGAEGLWDIEYVSEDSVFVLGKESGGEYKIWVSADSGKTFAPTLFAVTDSVAALFFIDGNNSIAVGEKGKYYISGSNWVSFIDDSLPNTSLICNDVWFNSDTTGFITTFEGDFYSTSDGGNSWTLDPTSFPPNAHKSITFTDDQNGFIASGTSIIGTADGGNNWNVLNNSSNQELLDIDMIDPLTGYAVGRNGHYAKTLDGFSTILQQDSIKGAGGKDMWALDMISTSLGFAGGESGILMKYFRGSISGRILDSLSMPYDSGKVVLIRAWLTNGFFPRVDSIDLTPGNNTFNFTEVTGGYRYLIKVEPTVNDSLYFPTYYPSNFYWEMADWVLLDEDKSNLVVDMIAKPGQAALTGIGKITGTLIEADTTNKRGPGDPLRDEPLSLINQGSGNILAQTETDNDGLFAFNNIPNGDYELYIDRTGVPVEDHGITISAVDTSFEDITMAVDTGNNMVTVDIPNKTGVTGVKSRIGNLLIAPNPNAGQFSIQFESNDLMNDEWQLKLFDVQGRLIVAERLNNTSNQINISIDDSKLIDGLYLVRLERNGVPLHQTKLMIHK